MYCTCWVRSLIVTFIANLIEKIFVSSSKPHYFLMPSSCRTISLSPSLSLSLPLSLFLSDSLSLSLFSLSVSLSLSLSLYHTFSKLANLGLQIIPVVTKIDLPSSQPEETALAMGTTFQVRTHGTGKYTGIREEDGIHNNICYINKASVCLTVVVEKDQTFQMLVK